MAILDLDYHHGNGTQQIFYERSDVLYVSTHADPAVAYPQISGFTNEVGAGAGEGYNFNFPLPLDTDDATFLNALPRAVDSVSRFSPDCLVVSLGLDGAMGDPVGTWNLTRESFEKSGEKVGRAESADRRHSGRRLQLAETRRRRARVSGRKRGGLGGFAARHLALEQRNVIDRGWPNVVKSGQVKRQKVPQK